MRATETLSSLYCVRNTPANPLNSVTKPRYDTNSAKSPTVNEPVRIACAPSSRMRPVPTYTVFQ